MLSRGVWCRGLYVGPGEGFRPTDFVSIDFFWVSLGGGRYLWSGEVAEWAVEVGVYYG